MLRQMIFAAGVALALPTGMGHAQEVPVETATLGTSTITLHPQAFLTEEELTILRLVMVNADALALFVPQGGGHAAIAVSPDDGFIRDGVAVPSAHAVADLPDAAAASEAALAGCEGARKGAAACVVVLEVAPLG